MGTGDGISHAFCELSSAFWLYSASVSASFSGAFLGDGGNEFFVACDGGFACSEWKGNNGDVGVSCSYGGRRDYLCLCCLGMVYNAAQ